MSGLTDLSFFQKNGLTTSEWHTGLRKRHSLDMVDKTLEVDDLLKAESSSAQLSQKIIESPIAVTWSPIRADTTPLQIWEGTVLKVNSEDGVMNVLLNAKMGQVPRHTAEIDFEWVSDQDMDLVRPGAVFYLTLYKRTKLGGSIENSQELRFRRRPSWTLMELKQIERRSSTLLSKMTALPSAT